MIDIVDRLRFKGGTHVPVITTMAEAAAEIERLRKINDDLAHAVAWLRAALEQKRHDPSD